MNPSSDIIEVLAGLDNVDAVFNSLVETLDRVIKDGRASKLRCVRNLSPYLTPSSRTSAKSRTGSRRSGSRWLSDSTRVLFPASRLLPGAHEGTNQLIETFCRGGADEE